MKKLMSAITVALFCLSCIPALAANVNKDDAATIAKDLKGIGVKKAELIVAGRKDGKYKDGEDLAARVKGIGPKTVEKNGTMLKF